MLEKGWAILTVRKDTAKKIKEQAHTNGCTVDEFINQLMSPAEKARWTLCDLCEAKVKSQNFRENWAKVHPDCSARLTGQKGK